MFLSRCVFRDNGEQDEDKQLVQRDGSRYPEYY